MSACRAAISRACLFACATLVSGCGFDPDRIPGIYRIDVQQGNVVTQDMLDRLEPGMDKRRVRFVLGTPLITDTFNDERWDYLYSFQEGGGKRVQRRISVYFDGDRLARLGGDLETAAVRRPPQERPERAVTVPPREDEGGFLEALRPSFLKRKEGLVESTTETSTPEALGTTLSAPAPAEPAPTTTASAPAEPAAPAAPLEPAPPATPREPATGGDADTEELKRLFEGFGRVAGGGSTPAGPAGNVAGATEPASASPQRSDAQAEDRGFFENLMRRFRRATETAPAPDDPAAPASGTPPQ